MDTFTSVLGGFTIFAVLGNLANNMGKEIKDVVNDSFGLAFITYPEAISKIGASMNNAGYWPQVKSIELLKGLFYIFNFLGNGSFLLRDAFRTRRWFSCWTFKQPNH